MQTSIQIQTVVIPLHAQILDLIAYGLTMILILPKKCHNNDQVAQPRVSLPNITEAQPVTPSILSVKKRKAEVLDLLDQGRRQNRKTNGMINSKGWCNTRRSMRKSVFLFANHTFCQMNELSL
jgi:hypothetical protein